MALYVASYLLLLNPTIYISEGHLGLGNGFREADYRFGGEAARIIFAPLHSIDRKIRPDYWNRYSTPFDFTPVLDTDEESQNRKTPFD